MLQTSYEVYHYYAYLLRLWQERPATPGQPAVWRLSLMDARTGARWGFGSLEGLDEFLRTQIQAGRERLAEEEEEIE